jgi:solute carrier family 25 uncoupling protein 8/9
MTTSYYDVAAGLGAAGFAGGLSVAIMNPLDTLKVRYQVATAPSGMRGFAGQIVRQEGLWRGLWVPGVGANFGAICVSSVGRVGCYPYVRDGLLNAVGLEKNAGVMFVAGLLAGAVGYLVSSPVYQVKTLAQAEAGLLENGVFTSGASSGKAPRYASLVQGLGTLKRDGHLWRGAGALVVRGALLSAGMQVGYDGFKTWAKRRGVLEDGPLLHGLAACAGGVGAGVCATPADVVMTRYQASSTYRSAFGAAADILKTDGPLAFYRGFTPFVVRLGPVFLISLPLTEQIRRLAGLGYLS